MKIQGRATAILPQGYCDSATGLLRFCRSFFHKVPILSSGNAGFFEPPNPLNIFRYFNRRGGFSLTPPPLWSVYPPKKRKGWLQ